MNKLLISAFTAAALVATPALFAQNAPASGPMQMHGKREHHPEIRRALNKLHAAQKDLAHAAHDFGGHRAKAEDLVNQAIQELQAALAYDKK